MMPASILRYVLKRGLDRLGYEITRRNKDQNVEMIAKPGPYIERKEYGASNLKTKLERVKAGLSFEYSDIINLNNAVVLLLLEGERNILELGSGTGNFALSASQDKRRRIIASEFDPATYAWCMENVHRENITFLNGQVPKDLGPFDVIVSIEVIEHVSDYCVSSRVCILGFAARSAHYAKPKKKPTTLSRWATRLLQARERMDCW